jgi:aspartyl-tRNA(Asn)/glutamyl-tRNA(Gln) amidotransferase subunit B
MAWEIVVGIETHCQLLTKSKMFSGASTAFGAPPNTQACALDIALPGTLPVANRAAVEHAIRFGLAVKGDINRRSIFARKNYFYPDLPKGYQISQYETPVVQGGELSFFVNETQRTVRLTRAHLEEDAGKSLHEDFRGMTGIDLNRAGTPLLEIVSEPELRGAKEAIAYARALHSLVTWIGICDGNMQEGSFRCDANVSVRKTGDAKLGTRCEIKNLNSFRFMEQAIEFEARRQIDLIEDGKTVTQETRLYDPDKDETRSMRSKEDAHDYRYFPDPDLLPLIVTDKMVDDVRGRMPELQETRRDRYIKEYQLGPYDAGLMTNSRATADYFDEAIRRTVANMKVLLGMKGKEPVATGVAKLCCNWISGPLAAALNEADRPIERSPISPARLAELLARLVDDTISNKAAKNVFDVLWSSPEKTANDVINELGLKQISDAGEIEKLVDEAIAAGAKQVADYRAGKEKALQSLVGQVMKASRGKANPAQVNEILRRKLGG